MIIKDVPVENTNTWKCISTNSSPELYGSTMTIGGESKYIFHYIAESKVIYMQIFYYYVEGIISQFGGNVHIVPKVNACSVSRVVFVKLLSSAKLVFNINYV